MPFLVDPNLVCSCPKLRGLAPRSLFGLKEITVILRAEANTFHLLEFCAETWQHPNSSLEDKGGTKAENLKYVPCFLCPLVAKLLPLL